MTSTPTPPGPGASAPPEAGVGATEAAARAVAEAHRGEWALVLAATVRTARDLDLAEECVQEAYAAALSSWPRDGIPRSPAAWLTTAARRRAIDVVRREHRLTAKLPLLVEPGPDGGAVEEGVIEMSTDAADPVGVVADERLRLVFLCCHPALHPDAQVALTLRLVCGLSTADIAAVSMVSESTMAARITRAKKKIVGARIAFRMPDASELPDRVEAALETVYLLFTAGHTAPTGEDLVRHDVADAAVRLARVLHQLLPDEVEAAGLLALLLVTDARRAGRTSPAGELLRLEDQDRTRWDSHALDEGHDLIVAALRRGRPGRYTLQAAIASLYARAPTFAETDWAQILTLYDRLLQVWPSPVVALNRVVPLSHVIGPAGALQQLEELARDERAGRYRYLPAVRADLLDRLGRHAEARQQYRLAHDLSDNAAEKDFLLRRAQPTG